MASSATLAPLTAAPPAIEVHDLTVAYHTQPVLWDVDVAMPPGKLIAIVGPNGAGKSTLLKAILGLVPLTTGWVRIDDQALAARRQTLAYIPQRTSVDWDFPTSALDVVLMGTYGRLGWFRRPGQRERDLACRCLEQMGIADLAQRQISQLSGGQQQRVFLARALAQEARTYLMDEPFAGVDATTERTIVELLRQLRDQGRTVVAVHHDLQTVPEYFDWVVLLNLRLVAAGPVEEVFNTENLHSTYGGQLKILSQAAAALLAKQQGLVS
ncbi:MAG TPA: metal ABC transporter ATP-binding protein [Gemmatales bacterium]|nr:metal ABC transporter ATP-binding protein [Gemmatales bacterium]HMP58392.1 metal ABC transporter ATP-binding protein [Gemmatales bacterium]